MLPALTPTQTVSHEAERHSSGIAPCMQRPSRSSQWRDWSRAEADASFEQFAKSRRLTMEQARHGLAHALVGTPDDILERLESYRQAGVDLAWVFLLFNDLPQTTSMRLFADEVMPAIRRTSG